MKIFSIYDSKAEAYITPFFSPTTATAIRQFEQACNDQNTDFHKFAGDYTLFEIGNFDEFTAKIDTPQSIINLGLALTFIIEEPSNGISIAK